MTIQDKIVVGMHYSLKNDAGDLLDSSEGGEPLTYLHGARNIIPGLERELTGKAVGDSLDVVIEPEDGYGVRHEELVQQVPRSQFDGVDNLEVGMQFQGESEQGTMIVRVIDVTGDTVTVDGNHELAGQRLHFSVQVVSTREATAEEVDHGHVH